MTDPNTEQTEEEKKKEEELTAKQMLKSLFDEKLLIITFLGFLSLVTIQLTLTLNKPNWLDPIVWFDFLKAVLIETNVLFGGLIARVIRKFQAKYDKQKAEEQALKDQAQADALDDERERTKRIAGSYFALSRIALASDDPNVREAVKTHGIKMITEGVDLVNIALDTEMAEQKELEAVIEARANELAEQRVQAAVDAQLEQDIKNTLEIVGSTPPDTDPGSNTGS
jgi:hypothetical protein